MRNYTRNMRQQATYWPPGTSGGFGATYGQPEPVRVRWEDKAELFRDADGNEVTSSAIVYVPRPLPTGGYLALGEHAGTPIEASAREIRQTATSPSLDQRRQISKAYL